MAVREGNWWSRAWGVVSVAAFAVHFGAAVYEAAVIAPLWCLDPPKSVSAWLTLAHRPDSSALFHPLGAVIVVATAMSWISGLTTRGWRRWWLTLAFAAAAAFAATTVVLVMPCERQLFGAVALGDADGARIVALTGDWIRAAAFRLAALLVGFWAAYRAQVAGMVADLPTAQRAADFELGPVERGRGATSRGHEFSLGDDGRPEVALGDEASNPRERWRGSLPARRRTAKK